jgi:hypothetical protein
MIFCLKIVQVGVHFVFVFTKLAIKYVHHIFWPLN